MPEALPHKNNYFTGLANCNDSQDLVILRKTEKASTIEIWKQNEELTLIAREEIPTNTTTFVS